MNINEKTLEKAYKKLKSSVYFDKTQLILRNAVVEFESEQENIDNYLLKMYDKIIDSEKFNKLKDEIINSISVVSFPKKLENDDCSIIMNSMPNKNKVKELQHFIDMKVEGHILGVLWIMLIGYKIDKKIYEHSYGNRIRKNLINELSDNPTYSPYLFEPYFEQYESWRDKAMSEAAEHMMLKQDVVIITMDFRRYYYSVDMDAEAFESLYTEAVADDEDNSEQVDILKRLNDFIYSVVEKYSVLFGDEYKNRHILPIGFLPSNIISNWCLKNFDKAVVDGWNPVYYGRYVDDVLIVDKVEKNSDIYQKAKNDNLTRDDIIDFFLKKCSKWNGINMLNCQNSNEFALIQLDKEETQKARDNALKKNTKADTENINIYRVNSKYNAVSGNKSEIIIHNDKVKIFYFKSVETDALLTCFKENISKNKSEFRHLPEDEAIFQRDDYSEIYTLNSSDTINKFRGIDGISLDRFKLSKFLGKYLRIGGLIEDNVESRFEKDILKIFNLRTIIENYTVWEKIIEIFVINERFRAIENFAMQIIAAIESIEYDKDDSNVSEKSIKNTLYLYFHSALLRSFALVWKDEREEILHKIYDKDSFANNMPNEYSKLIKAYCQTCMIDKSVMPIIISMISKEKLLPGEIQANLTKFNDVIMLANNSWNSDYKYYPYLVNMYDFCIISCIEQFQCEDAFENVEKICEEQIERYIESNYRFESKSMDIENDISISVKELSMPKKTYQVSVGRSKKSKLKIAIANVKLNHKNFERLVKDNPNRSYERYHDLSLIVNSAIDQKADMLIMPESFVPYEWLSTLARTCAKNNLAIVTGIEHIKYIDKIFNLTAVILPYLDGNHKCAHISFHLKTYYAPNEKEEINGYRLIEVNGKHYELYKWNNCYFPVYCCYELTSILDRALFQSYADFLIAVEWNKDTNYYSNILESLSRDIHCYCIQVNTSNYGDSRITQPSKTEQKDVIRTKGGINSTILVDNIDIDKLREFQLQEYTLQKRNINFKVTPPNFNADIIMKKIKGEDLFL